MDFIGTLGPSCLAVETLTKMFLSGMTGMRLNLSHAGLRESAPMLEHLFQAADRAGVRTKLIIDMQGPELRVGVFKQPMQLVKDREVSLGAGGIPVPACIFSALAVGDELLLDDGKLLIKVIAAGITDCRCRVVTGGVLASRKSIAIVNKTVQSPTLTAKDLENIACIREFGVTGVMQPFVRDAEDLKTLRAALVDAGAGETKVYAKIEDENGVRRMDTILKEADEIVIARGDLANAVSLVRLPEIQKRLAACCQNVGKPFMVATQLLASMEHSPVPTRAEVLDIFNAVLDGAESLIVTSETAIGEYPVETIDYLERVSAAALAYRHQYAFTQPNAL